MNVSPSIIEIVGLKILEIAPILPAGLERVGVNLLVGVGLGGQPDDR